MIAKRFWRTMFAVLIVIVTYASLTPDTENLDQGGGFVKWLASILLGSDEHSDKIGHFLAYAALGFCVLPGRLALLGQLALTFFALFVYGCLMEGLQGFSVERQMSTLDAVANTTGLIAGGVASLVFERALGQRA